MQRLVWQNANGDVINLTSGNYGITEWEGFSNASLNIQSQQVPFQDGGVFLDALIEQRELSVTLKMQDNGNLEERYRMRRELIHALNPKLGEGYLIYTNDFISKRIKCVAQIPLFETHNSNDSGTPKASLAWTACEPYWEDLEETQIFLKVGQRTKVINNGDVPTDTKIELFSDNVVTPQVKNFTNDKLIKLNGSFQKDIVIETKLGQKNIYDEDTVFNISEIVTNFDSVIYSEDKGLFVAVGGIVMISSDGQNWEKSADVTGTAITYSENLNLFVIVSVEGKIYTSADLINWTERTSGVAYNLYGVDYSESLNMFVVVGQNGTVLTSPDGITWTARNSGIADTFRAITHSDNLLVAVGYNIVGDEEPGNESVIVTSPDGINWTLRYSQENGALFSITYARNQNKFVTVGGGTLYVSSNGINWVSYDIGGQAVTYSESLGTFIVVQFDGVVISYDGINWTKYSMALNANSITFSEDKELFVAVGDNGAIFISYEGYEWNQLMHWRERLPNVKIIYQEKEGLFVGIRNSNYDYYILTSTDGINWTTRYSTYDIRLTDLIYVEELGMYVATGLSLILTSTDGINWTVRYTSSLGHTFFSIAYSERQHLFVIVGIGWNHYAVIFTSTDGINWSGSEMEGFSGLRSVVCAKTDEIGDIFVAVGDDGTIMVKDGGWDTVESGVNTVLHSITYSEDQKQFVVVGGYNTVLISKNNSIENWQIIDVDVTPMTFYNVSYIKETTRYFILGSNGIIMTSYDGEVWDVLNKGYNIMYSMVYVKNQKMYIIVGNQSMIKSSTKILNNLISKLSPDSNMTFNLEEGINVILLSRQSGIVNGSLSYRQKYIGV